MVAPRPQIFSLVSGSISIIRTNSDFDGHHEMVPQPQADAHSIIVQLKPFKTHRLWQSGKLIHEGGHEKGSISITDLAEDWRCHHGSSFDNLRFTIPKAQLTEFSYQAGGPAFTGLLSKSGQTDSVVENLAMTLVPQVSGLSAHDPFFIEHVLLALQSHLVSRYAENGVSVPQHGLSKRQLDRAFSLLSAAVDRNITINEVADHCGLSTTYFIRAFKQSTHQTPYRWLMELRTEKAKTLLLGSSSLAEIALACGFADQSHFTHVFTRIHGVPPGRWRHLRRS